MKFKLFFPLLLCSLFFALQCSKDKTCGVQDRDQGVEGELTGFDGSKCGCCWGWIFQPATGEPLLIGSWPTDFPLQPATVSGYPVKVRVEFTEDSNCFNDNRKVIATRMELR